jgi:hypothetical protein
VQTSEQTPAGGGIERDPFLKTYIRRHPPFAIAVGFVLLFSLGILLALFLSFLLPAAP